MEAKEETTLERQAKMRERAKQLKDKREAERLEIVQQKLDERWRYAKLLPKCLKVYTFNALMPHIICRLNMSC